MQQTSTDFKNATDPLAKHEAQLLEQFDPRLRLVRHECEDGSIVWRIVASFPDGRPDEIASSSPKLAGIAGDYIKHAKRAQQQRARLEAAAARRGVPVHVLERELSAEGLKRRRQAELQRRRDRREGPFLTDPALAGLLDEYRATQEFLPPLPRHAPGSGAPRGRVAVGAASSSSSRGDPRGDDPDPPASRPCECRCGEPAPTGRRTVDEVHAGRVRLRRFRDRRRLGPDSAERRDAAARQDLDRFTREAGALASAVELRDRVNGLAARALEIRLRLPEMNGDGPGLRAELADVEHELELAWKSVRTAEAVTRR